MKCNFCNKSFKAKDTSKIPFNGIELRACGPCLKDVVYKETSNDSSKKLSEKEAEEVYGTWGDEELKEYKKNVKKRQKKVLENYGKISGKRIKTDCKHFARSFQETGIVCKDCGQRLIK